MKRMISLLIVLAFLLSAAACSRKGNDIAEPDNTPAPSAKPTPSPEPEPPEPAEPPEDTLELLSIMTAADNSQEWGEDVLLCQATWHLLKLGEESALLYPELAAVLDKNNAFSREHGESFVDESLEWAQEMAADREYFYSFTWTDEYTVQRADEHILSVRGDWSSYTGGAHPNYGVYGMNLDPESGEDVLLTDILTETDGLTDILIKKIREKYPDEPFDSLPEMLADYELENYSWTLSYQGLTFYFSPYEIASYAAGLLTVTIWFDEAPELFREEYMETPEQGYAVALPLAHPVEFDLDEVDGKRDEISVSYMSVDGTGLLQPAIGKNDALMEDADGYAYEMRPYLVHIDGKNYIYLEGVVENAYKTLSVYDLNGDEICLAGRVYGSGFKRGLYEDGEYGGYYIDVFNDPENFVLSTVMHVLGTVNGTKACGVNPEDGMPAAKTEYYDLSASMRRLISKLPLEVGILPDGTREELPAGTMLRMLRTDGETYMDLELEDGRECRLVLERNPDTWEWLINGISEWDCFEDLLYAG